VSNKTPEHPLSGIKVVEVGIYMAGPFCGMQLADLGADVIKVENPDGGDTARDSAPFLDGESSPFIRLNRNKRSLAVNLKTPEGKELYRELVRGADIVVENLRPGTMADLELDYLRLAKLNPRWAEMFVLRFIEDYSNREIAGLMNTSAAVVAVVLHRTRTQLKKDFRGSTRKTR